ncbi:MAG: hypothetical protein C4520_16185 [Candidatus Abyssobacteria bacterium SURF_5]|uniref:Porin n=1 Tax=Abyssobacteria bacterium (strain SURF_5) TaxID=2093360 RepID=A0A3A4NP31_ABYX5|nr:MAG: hypothetical protein C4520_16185 [Candidatus Abyssubacteria bacterium SURF_5]
MRAFTYLFVFLSAIAICGDRPCFAEESLSVEDRVLRMEQEIRELQRKNEILEQEVQLLREIVKEPGAELGILASDGSLEASPVTEAQVAPQFDVGYKNGFFIASDDDMFALQLGGRVTGRLTVFESDYPLYDEFSLERARLETDATVFDYYTLRVTVEFADSPKLKDGYIDVHYFPEARLRAGQFKVPFSWEALQSHKYLDFADLSLAVNNMRGSRDIGAMVHGVLFDDLISYQLAVLNGSGENRGDNNSSKDIAARVALLPFVEFDNELTSSMLLGASGTYGDQNTDLSDTAFRTIAGTEFVQFLPDSFLKGTRTRLGTEFIWPIGPASIKSEWMRMWFDDLRNTATVVEEDVSFDGWYVSGTYLLTGEKKTLGRLIPLKPFDPFKRTWGAWELAARYSLFASEDDLFDLGFAEGTEKAEAFTAGLNWYLNANMRMIFDFEHTEFEDELILEGESVDDEDVLFVQWQLEF